jgi:hypothetical protein
MLGCDVTWCDAARGTIFRVLLFCYSTWAFGREGVKELLVGCD